MKENKVIWHSKNISNDAKYERYNLFIRDMGDEYRLDSATTYVIFDKKEEILKAVIDVVKDYDNLFGEKNGTITLDRIDENGIKHSISLVQVIAAAHRYPYCTNFKNKRFYYLDNDYHNLHSNNFYCSGQAINTFSRFGSKYIVVVCVNNGDRHFAVTNYSKELFKIINNKNWYYDVDTREIMSTKNIKLKQVVWAYFKKNANSSNIDEILEEMKIEFNPTGSPKVYNDLIVLDHKVSGFEKWDTRIENLQPISFIQNLMKGDCTSLLRNNSFYIPTLEGEIYGVYEDEKIKYYERKQTLDNTELKKLTDFCRKGILPDNHVELDYMDIQSSEIFKQDIKRMYIYEICEKFTHRVKNGNFFEASTSI